jgi:hypothetical protein
MPTKKQRRRQQKSRRHEYEYVYVDDEGNEVAVDRAELKAEKDKNGARQSKAAKDNNRQPSSQTGRRRIEPPSWRRSARRALVLGPLLVVAMMFFNRNLSLVEQIAPALFLIAFFIPFSYFTDSLAYRMYKKRLDRRDAAKTAK